MSRSGFQFATAAALALGAFPSLVVAQGSSSSAGYFPGGTVAGLVRDTAGLPQMGALVQIIFPDTVITATAITDPHGRYTLKDLPPGNYEVRATAALFLPAMRNHLHVERGSRSVVNLTLSTLLAAPPWLPATRKAADTSSDDWTWTLRSSANRPILRVADGSETANESIVFSSSATERRATPAQGRVTLIDGDGGFARGGAHDVMLISSGSSDEGNTVLRADFSGPRSPYPVNPSADISVGMQRRIAGGGLSRSVLSYTSHPELTGPNGALGLQGTVLRNAQRFNFGDTFRVDAGSVISDANMMGNAIAFEPFLHMAVSPASDLLLAYSYTAAPGTEGLDDLNRVQAALPTAISVNGRLRLQHGHHQAFSASTRLAHKGTLELAVYRDVIQDAVVSGSGALTAAEVNGNAVLSDPTTQSFRAAVQGYKSAGVRVFVSEPITPALSVSGQFTTGEVLVDTTAAPQLLADTLSSIKPRHAYAAQVAVDGKMLRTGTDLHASYRSQPERTLTAVDAYHSGLEGAYLSCILRQPLRIAHILPDGVDAVVDVRNLLSQGYQPFLSKDGRTLFLAESPRVLQAGLSFSF